MARLVFKLSCAAAVAIVGHAVSDDVDKPIILAPPANTSGTTAMMLFVPGGLVPNDVYVPVMQELQNQLQKKSIDLWVTIPACDGRLCVPFGSFPNITAALESGRDASGVGPELTWLGGHSLGGASGDFFCRWKATTEFSGCAIWGAYTLVGPSGMADLPVPFMQLEGELDYGSARITKMAPFFRASEEAGEEQMLRTPVVVIPDIDHSDMCEGFAVEGDLPSDTDPETATKALAKATSSFMEYHMLKDEAASQDLRSRIAFTKTLMDPINAALDLEKGSWCENVMTTVMADKLRSQITVQSIYPNFTIPTEVLDATAGVVDVTVSANFTNNEGSWPPGQTHSLGQSVEVGDVPAVQRGTASSLSCRMVKRTVVADMLEIEGVLEPVDACATANKMAMMWALRNAPDRVIERYARASPCNNCAAGIQTINYGGDVSSASVEGFKLSEVAFQKDATSWTMSSPSFMTADEHSCMLLSPARALDFLMFDAYEASIYPASKDVRPVPPIVVV